MKTTLCRRSVRLSLALCLASASQLTMAQTLAPDGATPPSVGEVVVTAPRAVSATKSDTPIVDIPQSVTVVTRDRLDRQVITDSLTDILAYTPGVLAAPFGFDSRVDRFTIRGFDAAAFGLYRDSLQLPSFGDPDRSFRVEPYGVEQLEILRGPSSVLYGNGPPGGLVNAISKRPTRTPFGEVEFEAGSYDRYAGKFDFGGPIDGAGRFTYRLTGLARDSDTQVDFARNNRLYLAPALTWAPDADTTLTILTHVQRSLTAGFAQNLPAEGTLFPSPNGRIPVSRNTGEPGFDRQRDLEFSVGYALNHRFTDHVSFVQNARHDHLSVDARTITADGFDPDDPAGREILRGSFTGRERADAFALDNQLHLAFHTGPLAHALIAGVEYKHYDLRDAQGGDDVADLDVFTPKYGTAVPPPPLFYDARTRQGQTGVYLGDRATFGHLVLSLGGREDFVNKSQRDRVAGTDIHSDDTHFDKSAGLVYLFDNGLAPYFSYSESFIPLFGADARGRAFDPETGQQYEVGIKYQPKGRRSFVAVDVFDLKRRNVLVQDPDNPDLSTQTGHQKSRGAEFEADLSLLRNALNIDATYTYQDVRTTRDTVADVGLHPATIPENIASLYADYRVPTGRLEGLGFGAGLRHQSSTPGGRFDGFDVSGFTVFDAAVHYDWRHVRFALSAKNIGDKRYVAECADTTACNYGEARSVVGTARYRF